LRIKEQETHLIHHEHDDDDDDDDDDDGDDEVNFKIATTEQWTLLY
jgi:fatty acid desaturase